MNNMLIKTNDKESGHFYTQTGEPAYRIIGKNGVERNTNLRDARERGLVPSVTTISGLLAKPGLNTWLQHQVLLAALTLPRIEGESEENWLQRVMSDAKSTGYEAANRGTRLHGVLEDFYKGKLVEFPNFVYKVNSALEHHFGSNQIWEAERSFASNGYGGKVDLIGDNIVVDFKSKEGDLSKIPIYETMTMQLAAYRVGLNMPKARCANVFFTEDGEVKIVEHDQEVLNTAWEMFSAIFYYWKLKNRYEP
jgi:hypothetical protein